jgi:hypothetical protein
MFTMMNRARLAVGLQGVAIAERALQQAMAYARERKQSGHAIIDYPDVKRMLLTMRALTGAARAICYATGVALDRGHRGKSDADKKAANDRASLLTPIAKAFSTDIGIEVASLGVQVHGGMGFIEETGAAQHYRDARIAAIYEGTNGIQAIDLVLRKLDLGPESPLVPLLDRFDAAACRLRQDGDGQPAAAGALQDACQAVRSSAKVLIDRRQDNVRDALAGATTFLRLLACTVAGGLLAEQLVSRSAAPDRVVPAQYFLTNVLPPLRALPELIASGSDGLYSVDAQQLASE